MQECRPYQLHFRTANTHSLRSRTTGRSQQVWRTQEIVLNAGLSVLYSVLQLRADPTSVSALSYRIQNCRGLEHTVLFVVYSTCGWHKVPLFPLTCFRVTKTLESRDHRHMKHTTSSTLYMTCSRDCAGRIKKSFKGVVVKEQASSFCIRLFQCLS